MARRGAGGDKARPYHCCERQHELFHWQIHSVLPFPYSLARGPAASRMMSILPLCFTMPSKYSLTAESLRVSITAACALPPCSPICLATASRLDFVRPDRKTSAPSAANSFATAAPMEPPAPNTTACLPCRISELFIAISVYYVPCFLTGRRSNSAITDIIS